MERVTGGVGDLVRPELLDESLGRDGLTGANQQAGQQSALAQRAEVERRAVLRDLELAKDPELRRHLPVRPPRIPVRREHSVSAR